MSFVARAAPEGLQQGQCERGFAGPTVAHREHGEIAQAHGGGVQHHKTARAQVASAKAVQVTADFAAEAGVTRSAPGGPPPVCNRSDTRYPSRGHGKLPTRPARCAPGGRVAGRCAAIATRSANREPARLQRSVSLRCRGSGRLTPTQTPTGQPPLRLARRRTRVARKAACAGGCCRNPHRRPDHQPADGGDGRRAAYPGGLAGHQLSLAGH